MHLRADIGAERSRTGTRLAVFGLALMMCATWSDEAEARGPGFKLGAGRLHLNFAPTFEYDSNVTGTSFDYEPPVNQNTGEELKEGVRGDFITRLRGGAGYEIPSKRLEFHSELTAGYNVFAGLDGSGSTKDFSAFNADANVGVGINTGGRYKLYIDDTFSFTSDPLTQADASRIDRNYNDLNLRLNMTPGGGAIQFDLGMSYVANVYTAKAFAAQNFHEIRPSFGTTWRFLPKTAMNLRVSYDGRFYAEDKITRSAYDENNEFVEEKVANPNETSHSVRASIGAAGQITSQFSASVNLGYADTFTAGSGAAVPLSFNVEGTWNFTPVTALSLSGYRSTQNVATYGFLTSTKAALVFKHAFSKDIRLSASGSFEWVTYGRPRAGEGGDNELDGRLLTCRDALQQYEADPTYALRCGNTLDREDPILGLRVSAEYDVTDWIFLSLNFPLTWNGTDYVRQTDADGSRRFPEGSATDDTLGDPIDVIPSSFLRFTPSLNVRLAY